MNTIFEHRSIRKYKTKNIPKEILNKLFAAGTRASNTGNMQLYSMVATMKKELREQLWEAHFKQEMVKQAPLIITFCADINRFNKWCELRDAKSGYDNFLWFVNAATDAILASQNVCLEAEYNKLGICYLGTTLYMAQKITDILQLPKGVIPITSLAIGYPDETPELTDRLPIDGVLHFEQYNDYSAEEIENIYRDKENLEQTKKLIEENKTENLAQIFTDKRYKKDDNVLFSKMLLELLEKQGFMNNK